MQIAPSIFKAYDIRGVVPTTLTEEVASAVGRAFGSAARSQGERVVAVGRDGRLSGPALSAALILGGLFSRRGHQNPEPGIRNRESRIQNLES